MSRVTDHGFQTAEDAKDAEEYIYPRFTLHERHFTHEETQMNAGERGEIINYQ